ncbi:hypothetical protein GCM10029976_009650 [Kribbella albertanoniae]
MTGVTLEQHDAELGLQRLDGLAQRRLRDAELHRRTTEMQMVGDGDSSAQMPQLHTARIQAGYDRHFAADA